MCYIAYTRFSLYITSTVTILSTVIIVIIKILTLTLTTKGLFILKKKKNTKNNDV